MKKVIRDGKVAVIYSSDFGAGWYSCNHYRFDGAEQMLFSPEIVAAIERDDSKKQIEALAETLFGDEGCYLASGSLAIEWLPQGTHFRIHEYDGSETVVVFSPDEYLKA